MLSLARVEVYGGGAGRRECGGDIHRNLAGLTHAGGHELAFAAVHVFHYGFYGSLIRVVDRYCEDCFALGAQYLAH